MDKGQQTWLLYLIEDVAGAVFRNDDYITPKYNDIAGPLGLQIDATALIETYADASKIKIYSDGAIETSGQLEVGGVGSTIDIAPQDAPIILVQLSRVFAEGEDLYGQDSIPRCVISEFWYIYARWCQKLTQSLKCKLMLPVITPLEASM